MTSSLYLLPILFSARTSFSIAPFREFSDAKFRKNVTITQTSSLAPLFFADRYIVSRNETSPSVLSFSATVWIFRIPRQALDDLGRIVTPAIYSTSGHSYHIDPCCVPGSHLGLQRRQLLQQKSARIFGQKRFR